MFLRRDVSCLIVACIASAGQTYAFSPSPLLAGTGRFATLRSASARSSCHAATQGLAMNSDVNAGRDRREFMKLATASAILPSILSWNVLPSHAEDNVMPETAVKVLQQIAGGSKQELDSFEAKPSKPLDGYDAEIYKVYKYAAFKVPATEDPRASLRGLFASKVADGVFKYAQDNGISPKIYDARGDGLTNNGKGGAVKGISTVLAGLKKKGLLKDFTVDASTHDENKWLQGEPSSVTVTVTEPAGFRAAQLLNEEKTGLPLSLTSSSLQGYFKQVKLFSTFEQSFNGDTETLKIALSWAGKERQKTTLSRRANDKLNAARAYTKDEESK